MTSPIITASDKMVVYEDDTILVANKPSGMLVHPGWGRDRPTLWDLIREYTGQQQIHPMHRIDRGTSGLVVFALRRDAARVLGTAFETGSISKLYVAFVRGQPPDKGTIDHPIPRKEGGPRVCATTHYRRLETAKTLPRHISAVLAAPQTGRLHQIRRHLKHISCPIIGDSNYGKGPLNRAIAVNYGLSRLALHALYLSFIHPETKNKLAFFSPLPKDLTEASAKMNMQANFDVNRCLAEYPS